MLGDGRERERGREEYKKSENGWVFGTIISVVWAEGEKKEMYLKYKALS